ncbi:MAG: DUF917 family protein [Candidatus Aminicenantes bacterium]|nr:DUF917 family protein [Candidatus Aminicenantes bacterium]NIM77914.1 DUF917 family protein [Candidatus Aminicenantes bacterium]NIN17231.1 DUF917 family protein [Candidatus Aminicenantes bacterium]NIN41118.1 DUF917 family protein [Candidatus Aminicenantes bacterium]NIN83924.1 DUF917 family protein [Candidatus Aminicenantes bacterium]
MSITKIEGDDLENIINGACFLGSGGGGGLDTARGIGEILKKYLPLDMCDYQDVQPYENAAVTAGVGAPSQWDPTQFKDSSMNSINALQEYSGENISYVIPGETGAVNSIVPMMVTAGSTNKIPIIDADGAGRAMPVIPMCTFALSGFSTNPSAIANSENDRMKITAPIADTLDLQLREIVTHDPRFQKVAVVSTFLINGDEIYRPNAVIPHTLTIAKKVGEALKLETQKDRIEKIIDIMNSYGRKASVLIEGFITEFTSRAQEGFDCGTVKISQERKNKGHYIEINFVNENLVAWFPTPGEKDPIWGPTMLCYMSPQGKPYSNCDLEKLWEEGQRDIPVSIMEISPAKEVDNATIKMYFKNLYSRFFGRIPG